jgi:hypothetical protein
VALAGASALRRATRAAFARAPEQVLLNVSLASPPRLLRRRHGRYLTAPWLTGKRFGRTKCHRNSRIETSCSVTSRSYDNRTLECGSLLILQTVCGEHVALLRAPGSPQPRRSTPRSQGEFDSRKREEEQTVCCGSHGGRFSCGTLRFASPPIDIPFYSRDIDSPTRSRRRRTTTSASCSAGSNR